MELNKLIKDNFWNYHTLSEFEPIAYLKNIHEEDITSICFLKDGRLVTSSTNTILIFNKNTFRIEIIIKEKGNVTYMNINKDGTLITCLYRTYLHLYEINGNEYNIIQTIKPYDLISDVIGKFDNSFQTQKFIELKNGNIAFLVWAYAVSFYKKKKKSKKYSYLNKYKEKDEGVTDLIELDNNEFCLFLTFEKKIQFLDMNTKKITENIKFNIYTSYSKNSLLLMNNKDILVAGDKQMLVIDAQKKIIINTINLNVDFNLTSMYKLSYNIILVGYWNNYIEQLQYDENTKEIKVISRTMKTSINNGIYYVDNISIFNNNFIVTSYTINNKSKNSSLVIRKFKK